MSAYMGGTLLDILVFRIRKTVQSVDLATGDKKQ